MWQRYNERLEQSVTWYVFMEWRAFFCRGPRLNWALWPGQGDTFLSRQKGTVSLAVIVFSTRCLCHRAQSFGNVTKKCIDRKFPQNPTESSATQLPKHRNLFGSFEVIFKKSPTFKLKSNEVCGIEKYWPVSQLYAVLGKKCISLMKVSRTRLTYYQPIKSNIYQDFFLNLNPKC